MSNIIGPEDFSPQDNEFLFGEGGLTSIVFRLRLRHQLDQERSLIGQDPSMTPAEHAEQLRGIEDLERRFLSENTTTALMDEQIFGSLDQD